MTHDTIRALAFLGVAGQVIAGSLAVVGLLALLGIRRPLQALALTGFGLVFGFLLLASAETPDVDEAPRGLDD